MHASDEHRSVYTPSEINFEVRLHLEAGFAQVWVEGEISNFKRAASGHCYFALKDEKSALDCAWFRGSQTGGRAAAQALASGDKILARGKLTLYERNGRFQLVVDRVEAAGEGLLQRRFEQLKKQLEDEGLFAAERKQALPAMPLRIAVVTSPTGAVIRDIVQVLKRRWPLAHVRLYPVPVQGDAAAPAIVSALGAVARHNWAEVVIVGRGGGSLEDLWAFNEESVARAIADCPVPVVSAVGHETDVAISDFVADVRAPTPSAAAELATPDQRELRDALTGSLRHLHRLQQQDWRRRAQTLDQLGHRLQLRNPARRLEEQRRQLSTLGARVHQAGQRALQVRRQQRSQLGLRLRAQHPGRALARRRSEYAALAQRLARAGRQQLGKSALALRELGRTLHALSPLPTLGRGFALLTDAESGVALTSVSMLSDRQRIVAQLHDGRAEATVTHVSPAAPAGSDDAD